MPAKIAKSAHMHANLVSDRPPLISILRILAMVLAGFVFIGPLFGILAATLIYDGDFMSAMSDPAGHPDIRNGLLLSQGIAATIGLILLPWYYLKFSEQRRLRDFFRKENTWPMLVLLVFVASMGLALAISPVVEWNATIHFPEWMSSFGRWVRDTEAVAESIIEIITRDLSPLVFVFVFVVVAILPAIGEELVFRGLIQTELVRATRNPHVGIWLASILFSAIHLQFLGFLPRTLIGAFLGYLYYWSGNLWIPVLAHFFNNGVQLVGLYLFQQGTLSFNVESAESAPLVTVIVSIILTLLLLVYFKNYFTSRSTPSRDPA